MARTQAPDYAERRHAILRIAARLYAENGFQGTSIADLAAACAMSKSLIYHYFVSKEAILYAIMEQHVAELVAIVETAPQAGDPHDRLASISRRFMDRYVGAADYQKVLVNDLDKLPDAQRATIVAAQRRLVDAVESIIADLPASGGAQAAGHRAATMLFFGMINWAHTWYDPEGLISPDGLAELATRIFTGGYPSATVPQ